MSNAPQNVTIDANGRIRQCSLPPFSVTRFTIIVGVISWLVATNKSPAPIQAENDVASSFSRPQVTNYGLFSLETTYSIGYQGSLMINIGGYQTPCHYDDLPVVGIVCQHIQESMHHQGPLLWSDRTSRKFDQVYTLHRSIAWTLCIATLVSLSFGDQFPSTFHRNGRLNAVLSVFFDTKPIPSLVMKIFDLNIYVYPTFQAMQTILYSQTADSPFRSMPFYPAAIAWLIGSIYLYSLVRSRLFKHHRQTIGLAAITSAATGYLASYQQHQFRHNAIFILFGQSMTHYHLTWISALGVLIFHGIGDFVPWVVVHCLMGHVWARWQLAHYSYWTMENWWSKPWF